MSYESLKEWNDPHGAQDVNLAKDVIDFLHRPVWVVIKTGSFSYGDTLLPGINKIFREEKDAFNWVIDEMRKKDHYRHKPDNELKEIASGWIYEIEVDDAY